MSDFTQSATVELLEHSEIMHPGNLIGEASPVAGWIAARVDVWLANIETTANATGVAIAVQSSLEATGDDWQDEMRWTGSTTAAETEALTATEGVGVKEIAVASTTNLTVGDLIYIADDTGVEQSEWHEIVKVTTNTSIEIADGLAVEKVSGDDIYDQAQRFTITIPCEGVKRIRVIVIHQAATGSNIRVKAAMVGATAIE
jgi:hypothetical protein